VAAGSRRLSRPSAPGTRSLKGVPPLAVDIVGIVNAVAAVLGVAAIGALVALAARPDRDREREEAARAHYDEHGRWPEDL
jgi:hypothetical protein